MTRKHNLGSRDTLDSRAAPVAPVPNLLYIGTSKAGSTWIYNALDYHPNIFMAPKGLYFFDAHYDRSVEWYLDFFGPANDEAVIGEVSHTYMFCAQAPARIASLNPGMRLMACLREPVDRAFSEYLDLVKNGRFRGSFEDAVDSIPDLVRHGDYGTYLKPYLAEFPRGQLHVAIFDDLRADPQLFADEMFRFLGVESLHLPPTVRKARMPAGTPRSEAAAQLAKKASRLAARMGLRRLRAKVKTSTTIRDALYRPLEEAERPTVAPDTAARLREHYAAEIANVDSLLGLDLADRWGYT